MPRLRQVPRAEVDSPVVKAAYDRLFGPDRDPVAQPGTATGTSGDWWTVFALVPDAMEHAVAGFAFYRSPSRLLPPELRELGQTRAGWLRGSQFVFSQHCKSCRAAGITEERIAALPSWQISDAFSPVERALLAYTDALVADGGRVPDSVFDALKAHLTDEQIFGVHVHDLHVSHARHDVASNAP